MEATSVDEREARGARTQSLFRDVNERVLEINDAFSIALTLGDWICECADQSCSDRISMSQEEYEVLRANPRRFAVAPSNEHVVDEIEDVVERNDCYWVVQKRGTAGELAAEVDPRRVGLRGAGSGATSDTMI